LREETRPGGDKPKAEQAIQVCEEKQKADAAAAAAAASTTTSPGSDASSGAASGGQAAGPAPATSTALVEGGPVDGDAGRSTRLLGLSIGGGGVVLTAVGVVFAFKARSDASKIEEYHDVWTQEWDDRYARQRRNVYVAATLMGVGVAAIGGGIYLYLRGRNQRSDSGRTDVAVGPVQHGSGMAVQVAHRF
jgi:hypothetical protein